MKAWRKPKSGDSWMQEQSTDEKKIAQFFKQREWIPGETIWFDATIDKTGRRGTEFGIEIGADDISAMQQALVRHYKSMMDDVQLMEDVLYRIWKLASIAKAPSEAERLQAIEEIADYFSDANQRKRPFKSSLKWLKWKSF